ncbi:MAG: LCP family protein [Sporomusaceae bacterium]|nr:LCP family protein [Sporomusaceae bacterium]
MKNREPRIRYRIRWRRVFLLAALFCVTVTAFTGGLLYFYADSLKPVSTGGSSAGAELKTDEALKDRVNILLLGVDDPDPDTPGAVARRSDTMIVASVNPKDGTASLLSIPRDTRVVIPGRQGLDKITHAYAYGGASLATQTVEQLLGVPISYYTAIDWRGFIQVIDILGGVDLYVEHDMRYADPYANLTIELNKGYQHLDGEKAGQYVRFRHDELGDIGRVQRQQRFLQALSDELLQVGTVLKIPSLVSTVNQYVTTDMNLFTMLKLANTMKTMRHGSLKTEMLPGSFAEIDGLSYWVPDQRETRRLVQRMFIDQAAPTVGRNAADSRIPYLN